MEMSLFEIVMLLCFGAAWPVSIYKSYTSRKNQGKSRMFLFVVFCGYLAGILHKLFYRFDYVIILYVLNAVMIAIDIGLYFRNQNIERTENSNNNLV